MFIQTGRATTHSLNMVQVHVPTRRRCSKGLSLLRIASKVFADLIDGRVNGIITPCYLLTVTSLAQYSYCVTRLMWFGQLRHQVGDAALGSMSVQLLLVQSMLHLFYLHSSCWTCAHWGWTSCSVVKICSTSTVQAKLYDFPSFRN